MASAKWFQAQKKRIADLMAIFGGGRFDVMTRQRRRRDESRTRFELVTDIYPNLPRKARRNIARNASDERLHQLANAAGAR
jgi:hypothetical protein